MQIYNGGTKCKEYLLTGGPGIVINLETLEQTSKTVNLSFTPGFSGGMEQIFNIQYKLAEDPDVDDSYIEYATGGFISKLTVIHFPFKHPCGVFVGQLLRPYGF